MLGADIAALFYGCVMCSLGVSVVRAVCAVTELLLLLLVVL
jgi:hypothetical protein